MPFALPDDSQLDMLWQAGCFINSFDGKHPSWTSFMHDFNATVSDVSGCTTVTDFHVSSFGLESK
jgi:hypothetical protein